MEKSVFEKNFNECLEKNFEEFKKYLEYDFKVFFDLRTSIFEVTKCLILRLDKATITLTNNILERLLKLALIYNEVGINPIQLDQWDIVFGEANSKYSSLNLGNSIELCRKHELITQNEKEYLFDTIRELMRNSFSHADPKNILDKLPEKIVAFGGNITKPNDIKKIEFNQKVIPVFQNMQVDEFVKKNSKKYFEYVFTLLKNIETRLEEKNI